MKTPERVEEALLKHGLAMKLPRADQTVRLRPDGQPLAGQLSVLKAKMRGVTATVARVPYRRKRSVR